MFDNVLMSGIWYDEKLNFGDNAPDIFIFITLDKNIKYLVMKGRLENLQNYIACIISEDDLALLKDNKLTIKTCFKLSEYCYHFAIHTNGIPYYFSKEKYSTYYEIYLDQFIPGTLNFINTEIYSKYRKV